MSSKLLRRFIEWLSLLFIMLAAPLAATAAGSPLLTTPAGLSIAEIKMTGDEFIVLQNNTAAPINDLGSYWLYAFNKTSPSISGASSSGQQLPIGQLDPGQTLLLSDKARQTCGAEIAGSLSLSLGDSNGYLQLIKQTTTNGMFSQTPGDSVSWGTDKTNGVTTTGTIPSVPSNTTDPSGVYYRTAGTGSGWQKADVNATNACELDVVKDDPATAVLTAGLSPATAEPPATIVSLDPSGSGSSDAPVLPAHDVGLGAPVLNELLPNPIGTGNDSTDEFIELYNPNTTSFDLSGFTLETGTTTKHKYVFPADTMLAAHGFTAFYSSTTGLSLSNSSGQADLLDPFGNALSQSDAYGTTKDGVAWALAKGKWYFTSEPTPNAANVIKQVATTSKKSSSKTSSSKAAGTVKGAATGSSSTSASGDSQVANVTPIHPWTLAVVAILAVAYGVYEYRFDLANRIYQFRKHRAARGRTRYAVQGR